MRLPDLRLIARIAMARCTREVKFEAVERHYIEMYQSNFLLCYIKFIPLYSQTGQAFPSLTD